jgi:hypothetical protein
VIETAQRRDELETELVGIVREMRAKQLHAARLLAEVKASGHYIHRGRSSIQHFGEGLGLAGREAWQLAAAAEALQFEPALEKLILDGKISLAAAAALLKVFTRPDLKRDGDDWLAWAEEGSTHDLETRIREREVEVDSGEPASTMTATLTASAHLKFERAQQVASRKEKRPLTEGQTIEVLADHYLDSFDPLRKEPGTRRMPSTEGQPGRHVPGEVAREVHARNRGKCSVPGCDRHFFVQKAHLKAHRFGGSREAHNLVELCWMHHMMLDHARLVIKGAAEKPLFYTYDGDLIRERGPPFLVGG